MLDAIDAAVVYEIYGTDHTEASGLSAYYPLQVQGAEELETFRDICVSPSYLGLVDRVAYGFAYADDVADYDNTDLVEESDNDWSGYDYLLTEDGDYLYDTDDGDGSLWDYLDEATEEEGESSAISFYSEPALDENGSFGFTLSEEGLYNAASVEALVFLESDDGELICIGETTDLNGDWETGEFSDNFDGYWFSLPDGQTLSTYLVAQADGYDLFTTPVEANGELRYLRFAWDYESGNVTFLDVWDGIDEASGAAGRLGEQLADGDVIVPVYDCYDADGNETGYYEGGEYTYAEGDQPGFELLFDGDYYYSFCVDDIYGNYYLTDMAQFGIEGDQVSFYA